VSTDEGREGLKDDAGMSEGVELRSLGVARLLGTARERHLHRSQRRGHACSWHLGDKVFLGALVGTGNKTSLTLEEIYTTHLLSTLQTRRRQETFWL
jgi:hypothetical protein